MTRDKSSILLLVLSAALVIVWAGRPWSSASVTTGLPSGPLGEAASSVLLSPGNSVKQQCVLENDKHYDVEFEAAATGPAEITAGFWSRSKDAPVQTFSVRLGDSGNLTKFAGEVTSGPDSRDLELRISSDWTGRWLVRDIRVRRSSSIRTALPWLALAIALIIAFPLLSQWLTGLVRSRDRILEGVRTIPRSASGPVVLIGAIALSCFVRDLAYPRPFAFGDEGIHSVLSKFAGKTGLLAGNQIIAPLPNSLYFGVYQTVFHFGENFFIVAKLFNAAFFCIGLLAIYRVLTRFLTTGRATFAIAVIGIGPMSVYGASFMPEMMYFCGFSVMTYFLVTRMDSRVWPAAAMAGATLGALVLVKPHGFLLVLPVVIALVFVKWFSGPEFTWIGSLKGIAAFVVSIAAASAVLNFVLTGEVMSTLGRFYQPMVGNVIHNGSPDAVLTTMGRHFGALCSLYGLPISAMAAALLLRSAYPDRVKRPMLSTLLLLLTTTLVTLLYTTSRFTVASGKAGTIESPDRLHGRYYFFLLPWMIAWFFATYPTLDKTKFAMRRIFPLCLVATGAISLFAVLRLSQSTTLFFPDFPEIFWFYTHPSVWRFVVLGLTLSTLTIFAIRRSSPSFLFGMSFGALGLIGTVWTTRYLVSLPPTPADEALTVFRRLIAPNARDNGTVLATDPIDPELYRFLFHLPYAYDLVWNRKIIPADLSSLVYDKPWVILVGNRGMEVPEENSVSIGRYSLYANPDGLNPLDSVNSGAKSAIPLNVKKDSAPPVFNLENVGGDHQSVTPGTQEVRAGSAVYISGWAVDQKDGRLPGAVVVVIDQVAYRAHTGIERNDVAAYFKNPRFARAGFSSSVDGSAVRPGRHTLVVRVFASDYSVYWESRPLTLQAR